MSEDLLVAPQEAPKPEAEAEAAPHPDALIPPHLHWLHVESLDLDAQGVAHRHDGKVVFIDGALPGEEVRVSISRKKNTCSGDRSAASGVSTRPTRTRVRNSSRTAIPKRPHQLDTDSSALRLSGSAVRWGTKALARLTAVKWSAPSG
jgi:hypothetical protein